MKHKGIGQMIGGFQYDPRLGTAAWAQNFTIRDNAMAGTGVDFEEDVCLPAIREQEGISIGKVDWRLNVAKRNGVRQVSLTPLPGGECQMPSAVVADPAAEIKRPK
jgi:hypothetical protein